MKLFPVLVLSCIIPSCVSLLGDSDGVLVPRATSQIPSSLPTPDPSWRHNKTRQHKHVHDFFKLFGWLRKNDTINDNDMPKAIKKIQKILHEPETGVYDQRMEDVMSKPKCGTDQPYNATDANLPDNTIHKRFVLWGPKWDHTAITYQFVNYTADVVSDRQRAIVSAAFAQWIQFLPVTIKQSTTASAPADIHVLFRSLGSADDAYAITNLQSAGLSMSSGLINITFNDDWNWTDDRMFNFTAVHEIGHALGLSHSTVEDAVMWPYYLGDIRPMHPDDEAAIHSLYGWKSPRWKRVDTNTGARALISVTSSSATPAALDGLYQIRSTGQVLLLNTITGTWTSVDNNKDTVQIAGSGGNLYQRHSDGSVYKYSGSGTNWQYIGAASDNVIDIIAAGDQIYQRRKDGWIARWSGSGTTWTTVENPRSSTQIAVTDSKTLWNLLPTGDLVRSTWPYGTGWTVVDQNPANVAIATGGDEFYKLQSDGTVVWLDSEAYYWRTIEEEDAVSIFAVGRYLYSRHLDGSIWRYTGTPLIWEQLDSTPTSLAVVGDRKGNVWELLINGDVMQLVS